MSESLSPERLKEIIRRSKRIRILVLGDLMLDQFIWGAVRRISPEAPVPVVEFDRESLMPGGAANVARNLTSLGVATELFGLVGHDDSGRRLKNLLTEHKVECCGVLGDTSRPTSIKTRIIAHQQQLVRLDRERSHTLSPAAAKRLLASIESRLESAAAVIIGDYGKGTISQELLDRVKIMCREKGVWVSLDPKPTHQLNLTGLSLITPNRKEAFELAGIDDRTRHADPLKDEALMKVADLLLKELRPALLLITLGDQGMLLCRESKAPFHIPTVAQEVFDVSGAGDTVIASFTLAIAAGASPIEAAVLSNFAAGVVVGKLGTATLTQEELIASLKRTESSRNRDSHLV